MSGLLLAGYVSGVFWADRGFGAERAAGLHSLLSQEVISGAVFASLLAGCVLLRAIRPRGVEGEEAWAARMGTLAVVGCVVASMVAGAVRLAEPIRQASRDARLAEDALSLGQGRYRVVEAKVSARRGTAWGEELLLEHVLAVDGHAAVPRRLLLRLNSVVSRFGPAEATASSVCAAGEYETKSGKTPCLHRAEAHLWPGTWTRIGVRIRPIHARRNPGSEDRDRGWARKGIGAKARLVDPSWVVVLVRPGASPKDRIRSELHRLRRAWISDMSDHISGIELDTGIARALALGDRSGLSSATRESFRALGLAHLLAVSGLHVGLVGALAGWVLFLLLRSAGTGQLLARAALIAGVVTGCVYAWMSGASISAQRAALLMGLFGATRLMGRTLRPARALSWTGLCLLSVQPAALFDLGSQLSFGACAGLIVGGFWKTDRGGEERAATLHASVQQRVRAALDESFWMSIGVSLSTVCFLFRSGLPVSVVSPLLNVLAIPWTGIVVLPGAMAAAMGSVWLPDAILWALLLPAHATEWIVLALSEGLPARLTRDSIPLGLAWLLSGVGLLVLRQRWRRIALLIWVFLSMAGSPPARHGDAIAKVPRIVFFDMGQGDAALVQGESAAILIDTGGGRSVREGGEGLVRSMRSLGIGALDVLAVTHGDLDHRAGSGRILAELAVQELWLPDGAQDDSRLEELVEIAADHGVVVRWLASDVIGLSRGDLEIEVLWPLPAGGRVLTHAASRGSRNDGSLVLMVRRAGMRSLFAADIGGAVEKELVASSESLGADLLKVGHHGSRHSTTAEFLAAVSPTFAVVSAPCDPSRGLPHPQALSRLERAGVKVGWTGRDGALSFGLAPGDALVGWIGWGRPRRCGHGSMESIR